MTTLLLSVFASTIAWAAPPESLPIQGFLSDDAGVPLDGAYDLRFRVYTSSTSSTTEIDQTATVDVDNGSFAVYVDVPHALYAAQDDLYLGVAIEDGAELTPRFRIATAPFAGRAVYADECSTLDGFLATDFRLAVDGVEWADVDNVPAALLDGDADTTYTAGAGITLTDTTFAANQSTIEGWAQGVAYDSASELTAALGVTYVTNQTCTSGFVLAANGTGGWTCTDPAAVLVPLTTRVSTAESSISTLQSSVTTAQSSISTLQSNVTALQGTAPTVGTVPTLPGASCLDIKTRLAAAPNGIYWVDTDAGSISNAFQVYCDMTTDGGGWTLVQQAVPANPTSGTNIDLCQAVGVGSLDLSDAAVNGPAKLPNTTINAMWSTQKQLLMKYDETSFTAGTARYDKVCKLDFRSAYLWNTAFNAGTMLDLDTSTVTCFTGAQPAITGLYVDPSHCGFGFVNGGSDYSIQGYASTYAYAPGCGGLNLYGGHSWLGPGNGGCNMTKTFVR